jgi:hypothetical protein
MERKKAVGSRQKAAKEFPLLAAFCFLPSAFCSSSKIRNPKSAFRN